MKKKLIRWIVIKQQPFTVTEEPSFHEFIRLFHPVVKLPIANTIKKNIMDCYSSEIKKNIRNFAKFSRSDFIHN